MKYRKLKSSCLITLVVTFLATLPVNVLAARLPGQSDYVCCSDNPFGNNPMYFLASGGYAYTKLDAVAQCSQYRNEQMFWKTTSCPANRQQPSPPLFSWSYAGAIPGKYCVLMNEPSLGNDGSTHTWGDNYLCSIYDMGIRWSFAGPINGMRCMNTHEPASPHTWGDNYLCVPTSSTIRFFWSSAGSIPGKACIKINEPADPHTWDDNYLCYE